MNYLRLTLSPLRKLFRDSDPEVWHDTSRCQFSGQAGNDYVREAIASANGGMCVAKFGTVELTNLLAFKANAHRIKGRPWG